MNTCSSDRYRAASGNAPGATSSPTPAAAPVPEVKDVNLKGKHKIMLLNDKYWGKNVINYFKIIDRVFWLLAPSESLTNCMFLVMRLSKPGFHVDAPLFCEGDELPAVATKSFSHSLLLDPSSPANSDSLFGLSKMLSLPHAFGYAIFTCSRDSVLLKNILVHVGTFFLEKHSAVI